MSHSRARKRFGQNFLVDRRAAVRIVEGFSPSPGEAILEIGPGRGALTGLLLERSPRIAAVELDRDLASELRERWDPDRLLVIEEDVLRLDFDEIPHRLGFSRGTPLAVVGNLPYNISKPVAGKLVTHRGSISRAVLMFQKEVADRLTAAPGSRSYGPLTVLSGSAFRIERLFDLPPGAFAPRPAVHSTVTSWRSTGNERLPVEIVESLRSCLSACFASRRRTIHNNLRSAFGRRPEIAETLLAEAGIDGSLRAEAVPPDRFLAMASLWPGGDLGL